MTTLTAKDLTKFYQNLNKRSDVFKATWYKFWNFEGLYSLDPVKEKLKGILDPSNPRDKEVVACCVSIKDSRFEKAYFSNKKLPFDEWFEYVVASGTIPFYMEPTHKDEWFDGGIREYVPIQEAARRCDKVISIATSPLHAKEITTYEYKWPTKALMRIYRTIDGAMEQEIKLNDYLKNCRSSKVYAIEPEQVLDMGMFEVSKEKMQWLLDLGYKQTIKQEKELLEFVA